MYTHLSFFGPFQLLRCYIIWRGTLWAVVVPGLLYLGSIGTWISVQRVV